MLFRAANSASACAAALLAACASSSPAPRSTPLSPEQVELCRELEQAYRGDAPEAEYRALRDRAAADPATAWWVTRMFVRDVITVREGMPLDETEDPTARADDRAEPRAVTEIEALGAAAVPALVQDLLRHDQAQPRELGIELLARIGAPAVPAVCELADADEPHHRRAAGRALGAIGAAGDVLPTLRRLATDPDYTVRADALRELHDGGAPVRSLLIERLRDDGDPFVRRIAAQALAHFRSQAAAHALVDHLARCQREGDHRGAMAAQESLQVFAGTRGLRSESAWRAFAAGLTDPADGPR